MGQLKVGGMAGTAGEAQGDGLIEGGAQGRGPERAIVDLGGKAALVTGSGRGIGKAIAGLFAVCGAQVMVTGTAESGSAERAYGEMRGRGLDVALATGDVRSEGDVRRVVDECVKAFGKVDILVNNAGVTKDGPLAMMSAEDWDLVVDTSLKGAFLFAKHASKHMIKNRYGRIVNITSVSGLHGNPGQANYASAKAGMVGLTKTLAKELARRGVTCNAIAPGLIESDMTQSLDAGLKEAYLSKIALGRFGTAEDVAWLALYLASARSGYVTGQVIEVDGGLAM
ncbi:MAG: 3-oxoacyl-[acyl-carrier-protein] reductase [Oscillospiraceae bacterium]|nr:3-oxoacyl-[acyl-carrier-protein] reductase [Oscillospiraceae bacterium]